MEALVGDDRARRVQELLPFASGQKGLSSVIGLKERDARTRSGSAEVDWLALVGDEVRRNVYSYM